MSLQKAEPITEEWVEQIAQVARIHLTEAERVFYAQEIADLYTRLDGMKDDQVCAEWISGVIPEKDLRVDEKHPCIPRAELMQAAKTQDGNFFLVARSTSNGGGHT